jgi:hypothetical protein
LENGNVVVSPVDKQNIYHRKINKKIKETAFAFPQVKAGSIVEYSYKLNTNTDMISANVMAFVFGIDPIETTWQFENVIPVYRADFFYNGPISAIYLQGLHQEKVKFEEGKELHWFVQDVPAFRSEPRAPERNELIGKLYIDLSDKTWSQMGLVFNQLQQYGLTGRDSLLVKMLAAQFNAISDPQAKIDSTVKYVKRTIKWNGEFDAIPERDLADVFEARAGSSSEINLIINSILSKANVKSHPVLISTKRHGKVSPTHPRARQFNSVVTCVVGDQTYKLIDGTDRNLPVNLIPAECLNGEGLLVDGKNSRLIQLKMPRSRKSLSAILSLNEKYEPEKSQMDISLWGLPASYERQRFDSVGKQKYIQMLTKDYPLMAGEVLLSGVKGGEETFKISSQIQARELFTFSGELIYVNPFNIDRMEGSNFLNSESRRFPIELESPIEETFIYKIELPKTSEVIEIPKPAAYSLLNNSARFSFSTSQQGNTLFISSQLFFTRTLFGAEEYTKLKEFYHLISNKLSEPIILKKKI